MSEGSGSVGGKLRPRSQFYYIPCRRIVPKTAGAMASVATEKKLLKKKKKKGTDSISGEQSLVGSQQQGRYGKKVTSAALENALASCREGMSDVQKSYVLQKEAKVLYDTGHMNGAIDVISFAINLNHVVPFFLLRASCYQRLHKWTEAYFEYCFAIQIEPEVGSHYSLRGLCLGKLKKTDLAIEDLTLACRYDPAPQTFITRATLHLENKSYESALSDCNRAINLIEKESILSPDEKNDFLMLAMFRRAQVYHEMTQYVEAIEDLKKVVNNELNSLPPRILLSRAYKMSGELHLAEEQICHVLLMQGNDYSGYMERGDIRYRFQENHKTIGALEDFTKVGLLGCSSISLDTMVRTTI